MARKTTRKQVNIKMPESLIEALKAKAEAEGDTFTNLVVRFCEQGLGMDNQNAHQTTRWETKDLDVIDVHINSRIADLEVRLESKLKEQVQVALGSAAPERRGRISQATTRTRR